MADISLNFNYSTTGAQGSPYNRISLIVDTADYVATDWHKIKIKRVQNSLKFYIDDVLLDTKNIGSDVIFPSLQPLRIGSPYDDNLSAYRSGLDGWIDELIIYTGSDASPAVPVSPLNLCPYVSQGQVRKMVNNVSGLGHLEGETVYVQADGLPADTKVYTVASATLNSALPKKAAVIHVGLKYKGRIKLLKPSDGNPNGTGQMKMRRIFLAGIRVFRSLGFKVGIDEDHLDPVVSGKPALPLITGDLDKLPNTKWKKDAQLTIIQDKPMPLFILALINQSEVEDI
jgi:hypothetical protein